MVGVDMSRREDNRDMDNLAAIGRPNVRSNHGEVNMRERDREIMGRT